MKTTSTKESAAMIPTYEEFLAWHKDASSRLQAGEWMAEPNQKYYAVWAPRYAEMRRAERTTSESWSQAG